MRFPTNTPNLLCLDSFPKWPCAIHGLFPNDDNNNECWCPIIPYFPTFFLLFGVFNSFRSLLPLLYFPVCTPRVSRRLPHLFRIGLHRSPCPFHWRLTSLQLLLLVRASPRAGPLSESSRLCLRCAPTPPRVSALVARAGLPTSGALRRSGVLSWSFVGPLRVLRDRVGPGPRVSSVEGEGGRIWGTPGPGPAGRGDGWQAGPRGVPSRSQIGDPESTRLYTSSRRKEWTRGGPT